MSVTTTGVTELLYDTEAGEWPISKTTVYNDQAEIRRSLSFKPVVSGSTLVKLRGLPSTINASSIRADIPSKNARLVEVFNDMKWEAGKPDEAITKKLKDLAIENSKLQTDRNRANFRMETINKHQTAVLDAMKPGAVEQKQCAIEPALFGKISNALNFYDTERAKIQTELDEINAKIFEITAEQGKLRTKQQKLCQGKNVYSAHILLDIPEIMVKKSKKTVDIDLLYLVSGASWSASYDIRVEKGVDKVSLTYYGQVVNATNEDWVEVEMSLSTAKPSVGGALPPLPRKQVDFKESMIRAQANHHQGQDNFGLPTMWASNQMQVQRRLSLAMAPQLVSNAIHFRGPMLDDIVAPPMLPVGSAPLELPSTALASGDAGSTLFKIQRLANIDSDNKPHRQTIAIVELDTLFTHVASPKVSRNVFLKLSTKNLSNYPLLPGVLGVFIDGSFVSNSEIELVRPNEDFALFLGIDDSVKLNYGPEVVNKKTVNSGGLMKTAKKWVKNVSRDITIINNSPNEINVCVYEQLPFAKDGKVKVELNSPDLKKKEELKSLVNSFNNVESRRKLAARKRFNMVFEYTLEWPEGQELDIIQKKIA